MSSLEDRVRDELRAAPGPDEDARATVDARAHNVLRPAGALARLDEIAVWLAGWQRTPAPKVEHPALLVFAGDHAVTDEGVSAYPASVTSAMLRAIRDGVATSTVMARALNVAVESFDTGVGRPAANIVSTPALSVQRFAECFDLGRAAVASTVCDLLIFGEMGIGNTTPAAAVASALFGGPVESWTGRGTGVDEQTWLRKVSVVERARARIRDEQRPLEILRHLGGTELVAIAGAAMEARVRSIPVILDGFVVTAAVAALEVLVSGALANCIAGHRSPEPGHTLILEKLGKEPILDLEMRLGEGSGALAALPLVQLAARAVVDVATFEEWGLDR